MHDRNGVRLEVSAAQDPTTYTGATAAHYRRLAWYDCARRMAFNTGLRATEGFRATTCNWRSRPFGGAVAPLV